MIEMARKIKTNKSNWVKDNKITQNSGWEYFWRMRTQPQTGGIGVYHEEEDYITIIRDASDSVVESVYHTNKEDAVDLAKHFMKKLSNEERFCKVIHEFDGYCWGD